MEKEYWDKLGSQSTEELCSQNRRRAGWEWEGEREVHRFRVDLGGGTDKTRCWKVVGARASWKHVAFSKAMLPNWGWFYSSGTFRMETFLMVVVEGAGGCASAGI